MDYTTLDQIIIFHRIVEGRNALYDDVEVVTVTNNGKFPTSVEIVESRTNIMGRVCYGDVLQDIIIIQPGETKDFELDVDRKLVICSHKNWRMKVEKQELYAEE